MLGKISQLTGNDKEDILALHDQYIALRKELTDTLFHLDSENIREINADIVNVFNLNASNINAGTLDAEIVNVIHLDADNIVAGTLNASIVDVINLDADNIVTGTLSADHIATDISQVYRLLSLGSGNRGANAGITFNGIASISADKTSDDLTLSALGYIVFNSTINVGDANFFGTVYGLEDSGYAIEQDIKDWVIDNFEPKA